MISKPDLLEQVFYTQLDVRGSIELPEDGVLTAPVVIPGQGGEQLVANRVLQIQAR